MPKQMNVKKMISSTNIQVKKSTIVSLDDDNYEYAQCVSSPRNHSDEDGEIPS